MAGIVSNCNPKLKSFALGKVDSNAVAWFTRIRSIQECNITGFRRADIKDGSGYVSNKNSDKPDGVICGLDKCDVTRTLTVTPNTPEEGKDVSTQVTVPIDKTGSKFQYGYDRFLIKGNAGDEFDITIFNKDDTSNGNSYSVTFKQDGWNVIVLELFNPDAVVGTGWIGNDNGFEMVIKPKQATEFSLSTNELFESANDLVRDQTFGFSCISDFSGDPALTITEDLCDVPTYDPTATTIERSITATKMMGEFAEFGGMTRRIDTSEFPVQTTGEFKPVSKTVSGKEYAVITLPDLAEITCPAFLVQPQNCDYTELRHMNIDGTSSAVELPDDMFFVDGDEIYMDISHLDESFVIAYPIMVSGTAFEITVDELNANRYHMEMTLPIGSKQYILQADNVLMTGIPWTWTNEAGTFTLPYTMVKDSDGKYGRFIRVDNDL